MGRLFFVILTLAATVLAGVGVIAALSMGMIDYRSIILAAGVGALLSIPVAWVVAHRLEEL